MTHDMAVGFKVGFFWYQIGSGDFLHCFFSTVAVNLENDIKKPPPWGNNISKDITDLSNYFVTSDGEDFLTVFKHALEDSQESELPIEIEAL